MDSAQCIHFSSSMLNIQLLSHLSKFYQPGFPTENWLLNDERRRAGGRAGDVAYKTDSSTYLHFRIMPLDPPYFYFMILGRIMKKVSAECHVQE